MILFLYPYLKSQISLRHETDRCSSISYYDVLLLLFLGYFDIVELQCVSDSLVAATLWIYDLQLARYRANLTFD